MGDLIHVFPALTDAQLAIPQLQVDWVVEENFASIPAWHPAVKKVIPVAQRRWRKQLFTQQTYREWKKFQAQLREQTYDLILDAQGLTKSAFLSLFAKGLRAGLDFRSAREWLAAFAYRRKYNVNFYQHAVVRMRSLFSQALNYSLPDSAPDFRLNREQFIDRKNQEDYIVFLHGTTWTSKQWPESYWSILAGYAAKAGYRIKMSGGSDEEVARAYRLAKAHPHMDVMPRLSVEAMTTLLAQAKAAIAVDTGFGHIAAALGIPTVSLYGSTHPEYTGAVGSSSILLSAEFPCSPCLKRTCTYRQESSVTPACYATLNPERVWEVVTQVLTHSPR
jgi:lipopolysaccharide heptosyltransferase I